MPLGEPKGWAQARQQRLAMRYPEFQVADSKAIMQVDAQRVQMGQPVTQYSQCVMRLASEAARRRGQ